MAENKVSVHAVFKDDASKGIGGLKSVLQGIGQGIGQSLFSLGTRGLDAVLDFTKGSLEAASNLNESLSKTGVVFGDLGDEVIAWSKKSASAFGMSENDALSAAATYGNLFRAFGTGEQASADMSKSLVELAGDLASFNNMDPTEVLEKLRAGLTGESEPLKTLGIAINEATLKQKAMELGLWSGKGALDANAKAQAAYALMMEQSTLAQGDFARTSSGTANQQRIMAAKIENAQARIGQSLTVVAEKALPILADALSWVMDMFDKYSPEIEAFGRMVGQAFGSIVEAVQSGVEVITQYMGYIQPVIDTVTTSLQSVVQIVQGIVEMIGALLRGDWQGVWDAAGKVVSGWLNGINAMFTGMFRMVGQFVKDIGGSILDGARGIAKNVTDAFGGIVTFIAGLPGKIASAAAGMWNGIWQAFKGAINAIIKGWNGLQFTLPSVDTPFGKVGGFTIGTPNIDYLKFHQGGIVPGGPSSESLGILRGGEGIFTPQQMAAMGGPREVHIHIDRGAYIDAASLDWLTRTIASRMRTTGVA